MATIFAIPTTAPQDEATAALVDAWFRLAPALRRLFELSGKKIERLVALQQGIPQEKAKDIVKAIKDSKAKVQASIQGDMVRVSGKDRDTLQTVMANLKAKEVKLDAETAKRTVVEYEMFKAESFVTGGVFPKRYFGYFDERHDTAEGLARRLRLDCTRFSSPSGILDRGTFSCPYDLATMARMVLANRRRRPTTQS